MDFEKLLEETNSLLGEEYVNSFLQREAGSRWKVSPQEFISLPWVEEQVSPPILMEGCRYFRAELPDITAEIGLLEIEHEPEFMLQENLLDKVHLYEGDHGLELYYLGGLRKANEAWCIVGNHQGKEVIFTAHPGAPKASIKSLPSMTRDELIKVFVEGFPLAVKAVWNREFSRRRRQKIRELSSILKNNHRLLVDEFNKLESALGEAQEKVADIIYRELPEPLKYIKNLNADELRL